MMRHDTVYIVVKCEYSRISSRYWYVRLTLVEAAGSESLQVYITGEQEMNVQMAFGRSSTNLLLVKRSEPVPVWEPDQLFFSVVYDPPVWEMRSRFRLQLQTPFVSVSTVHASVPALEAARHSYTHGTVRR